MLAFLVHIVQFTLLLSSHPTSSCNLLGLLDETVLYNVLSQVFGVALCAPFNFVIQTTCY